MRTPRTEATIRVATDRPDGPPLSKDRIAIYNSGLVPIERYERDREYFVRAGAESLRIDLGWGAEWMPRTVEVVQADGRGGYTYHFDETDALATFLTSTATRPYWSYCYVPAAARRPGQGWMGMAADDSVWVNTVRSYVAGARERGVDVGYHEVYNEPDLRDERTGAPHFYEGDLDDYLDLYRATSAAIRVADPHAKIGGPALAVTSINAHWLAAFLDVVQREHLPLDFLSFHHYGHFGTENTIRLVHDVLDRFSGFEHLELHLNEYNSFTIDYPCGGMQDTHWLASSFAAEIPRLLSHRAITRTHWAQFLDSGQGNFSGMIDIDGRPKPIYEVYEFYQQMPLTRVAVEVDGPVGMGAIASADGPSSAVLVWNRAQNAVDTTILLTGSADAPGRLTVVDSTGTHTRDVDSSAAGAVHLEAGAVALLGFGPVRDRRPRRCTSILERPNRDDDGWADVDEATGTVHVGTGTRPPACRVVRIETAAPGLAASMWRLVGAPGDTATPTIHLIVETDDDTTRVQLGGAPARCPVTGEPPRARRPGTTRLTFVLSSLTPDTQWVLAPEDAT